MRSRTGKLAGTGGRYDGVVAGDLSHRSHPVPDAGVSSHHHRFGATGCPPVNSDGTSCLCPLHSHGGEDPLENV